MKGNKSKYVKERIKRGAWSRLRKVSFDLQQISFILLSFNQSYKKVSPEKKIIQNKTDSIFSLSPNLSKSSSKLRIFLFSFLAKRKL